MTPLRAYGVDELGRDGYPVAWHRCPECDGTGWRCAHTDGPADFASGRCCKAASSCPSANGCPTCHAPGECDGAGSIKALVRQQARHRCVRCHHPYRTGKHASGEWSPCDERCDHLGPWRILYGGGGEYIPSRSEQRHVADAFGIAAERVFRECAIEARWRILTVHHLDGDPANCRWWNLTALCQRCHLTIQGKVVMDRSWLYEHSGWFKPYVAGYYAWRFLGQDLDREQTERRLEELLALEHRQLNLDPITERSTTDVR